ncbi:MAG: glycosyltransferase family 4 protein [Cyanobacteriota bacterium]|nr:glycosyltransferase family 4 protein [Cyanobacteriota bacterium]
MSDAWPSRVLVVAPQVWSRDGGVQRYSRSILQGMAAIRPKARVQLLTLLDRPRPFPRAALVLAALARSASRPQLVICTHLNLAPLSLLVARLSGAPFWLACHGIEVWGPLAGWRRLALEKADLLLPVSRFTSEKLQQQVGSELPAAEILPNTYDARRFKPGPRPMALVARYGLREDQPVLFALTRLSVGDRRKHLDRVIAAMAELRHTHPQAVLLIAGDGDDRPRLEQLAQQLGLEEGVLFAGRLAEEELADHFRLATAFVLPSDKEGFGIVFLEALGCGCPVLAGDRDGARDPLADGRFGMLVNPDLPLAEPLRRLLDRQGDPLWFQPDALSQAVAQRFAFPAFCERLQELLICHGKRPASAC